MHDMEFLKYNYENLIEIENEIKNFIAENFPMTSYFELSEFADLFIDLFSRVEEIYNEHKTLFITDFKKNYDYYNSFLENYESNDYFERYKRTKPKHKKPGNESANNLYYDEDDIDYGLPSDINDEVKKMEDWIYNCFDITLSNFEEILCFEQ